MVNYWLRKIWVAFAVCIPLFVHSQQIVNMDKTAPYFKRQWTMEDGLPQNSVQDIIQSKNGYLWIATNGGLARFDGINFEIFDISNSPNLVSNRITKLIEDNSGRILMAHETGEVTIYQNDTFENLEIPGQNSNFKATSLAKDSKGQVWIGSNNGLFLLNGKNIKHYGKEYGLENVVIGRIEIDNTGVVWASGSIPGIKGGHLFKLENEKAIEIGGLEGESIFNFTIDNNEIWVGAVSSVHHIKDEVIQKNRFKHQKIQGITSLKVIKSGQLLIGSHKGLIQFEIDQISNQDPYIFEKPLQSIVKTIFEDSEGNYWIGTEGNGLVFLTKSPVQRHIIPDPFNVKSFNVIAPDGNGGFWAGSQCEGLIHYNDRNFRHYTLKNNCIGALLLNNNNEMLVASKQEVRLIDRNGIGRTLFDKENLRNNKVVNSLFQDDSNTYWIGTIGGGVFKYKDSLIQNYTTENGLINNRIYHISQRKNGDILVGSQEGLSIINDDTVVNITSTSGLSTGAIRALYEDENNVLWIGSYGGGLTRIENDQLTSYKVSNGLAENVVSRITEDKKGNLWMMGNFGLYFTPRKQLNQFARGEIDRINCISLGYKEGMAEGNGAGEAVITKDSTYWWPTIAGLANIDISSYSYDTVSPKVVINELRINNSNRELNDKGELILQANERDFEVRYNTLSFNQPEKIQYQYKLEGYDKKWINAGNRRVIYYTNISPGDYKLMVKASNRHGIWNDNVAIVKVTVTPTIWETTWARVVLVLIGLAIIAGVFKWRISYLRHREHELEKLVEERTKALRASKAELETTLQSLEQAQGQLIESEKLASIGTLTSGLAHELNNPLGYIGGIAHPLKMDIEEIKSFIPEDRKGDFEEVIDEMNNLLGNLETGVKKASGIIKNLQNISPDGDTNQIIPFDLSEILGTTSLLLQKSNPSTTINQNIEPEAIIQANPIEINQLFQNIIQNSIDAIPEDTGTIDIELLKQNGNVNVLISDNGPGISEDVIGHIFEPFFTTKRPGKGTGLGLYISYSIIKKYSGDIKVSSSEGCGAAFKISLPTVKE